MSNNIINKVVFNGRTLIDLSGDTVTAADVLSGITFHLPNGSTGVGTCEYDVDSSEVTAQAAEVLASKTFAKNGSIVTGTMPNIGSQSSVIETASQSITISSGYHDGSGSVSIDSTEQAKITAGNIKSGVEILGVMGSYTGSELIKATTGTATPTGSSQTILPSSSGDYDYFTQFTVAAIPYTEAVNGAGGYTATIGSAS